MVDIKVPMAGESVIEATIGRIIKPSGSIVAKEEEILELETEKVNQVVFAPASGKMILTVKEGDTVAVGQTIGTIEETIAPPKIPSPKKAEAPKKNTPPPPSTPPQQEIKAPTPPPKAMGKRQKMSTLRRTIAKRLVEVKNQTAMLTTFNELDMTNILKIRTAEKEAFEKKHGVKLGLMSFFIRAAASALNAFPDVNAFIEGDDIVYNDTCDIGVAVSTDKGLIVPIIRNAAHLKFHEIEQQLADYAKAAREGTLSIEALQGGTFTITNGGVFGSLFSTPILNPPQSAILGMHATVKRPVAVGDTIAIRPMMYLALSYDHRIIDGKEAVTFLVHLKENLEDPTRLLF